MANFTEEDGIKIGETFYKHVFNMLEQALESLKKIAITQTIIVEKTPFIWDKDKDNINNEIKTVDYIHHCEKEEFNKKLSFLISEEYKDPDSFAGLQLFLFVGMRYYKEFLENESTFSLAKDLPILLTVDERMCRIFSMIHGQLIFSHKFTTDQLRTRASNKTRFAEAKKNKHKVLETIIKISKTDNSKRTLSGWSTEIVKKFDGSISLSLATTIMKENFKEKLTKGPRAKYQLSELIS